MDLLTEGFIHPRDFILSMKEGEWSGKDSCTSGFIIFPDGRINDVGPYGHEGFFDNAGNERMILKQASEGDIEAIKGAYRKLGHDDINIQFALESVAQHIGYIGLTVDYNKKKKLVSLGIRYEKKQATRKNSFKVLMRIVKELKQFYTVLISVEDDNAKRLKLKEWRTIMKKSELRKMVNEEIKDILSEAEERPISEIPTEVARVLKALRIQPTQFHVGIHGKIVTGNQKTISTFRLDKAWLKALMGIKGFRWVGGGFKPNEIQIGF